VLVEGLSAAHAEREPPLQLHRRCRGGLRDDRRVDAERRTGDCRGDWQGYRFRQSTDHRPDKRALALGSRPRMEMIGDPEPLETRRLSQPSLPDKFARTEFLTGQEISDAHHAGEYPHRRWRTVQLDTPAMTAACCRAVLGNLDHDRADSRCPGIGPVVAIPLDCAGHRIVLVTVHIRHPARSTRRPQRSKHRGIHSGRSFGVLLWF
jgi:hypothetical protein